MRLATFSAGSLREHSRAASCRTTCARATKVSGENWVLELAPDRLLRDPNDPGRLRLRLGRPRAVAISSSLGDGSSPDFFPLPAEEALLLFLVGLLAD